MFDYASSQILLATGIQSYKLGNLVLIIANVLLVPFHVLKKSFYYNTITSFPLPFHL